MDREQLQRRLMATFLGELEEHLAALNRDLLQLEKQSDAGARADLLQALFRTAHSLKGAARSVGVAPVEQACHRIEELLAGAREGKLTLGEAQFQRLFTAADQLQSAGRALLIQPPADAADPGKPADPVPAVAATAPEGFARIPGDRLETLLQQTDEVLVARSRLRARQDGLNELRELARGCRLDRGAGRDEGLARLERQLDDLVAAFAGDVRRLETSTSELHEQVRRLRMVPLTELVPNLERAVRDLARSTGKEAALVAEVGRIEVDRPVLQRLKDPLLQLCRNAVDHGIEHPADRTAAGKPTAGTVRLRAEPRGAEVWLSVADDGRGLDLAAIRAQAQRRGLTPPSTTREAAAVLFAPGFSTARSVTELSGRGVGLDVVKSAVEGLHGTVGLDSEPGRGTSFSLRVPVTLSTFRAVLFRVAGHVFALPASAIRRLERLAPDRIASVEGREMLVSPTGPIPLGALVQAVGLPTGDLSGGRAPVIIVEVGTRTAALVVDELLEEREVLLKPLGPHLRHSRFALGGTVLPDGQLALVLSPAALLEAFLTAGRGESLTAKLARAETQVRKRILVADDSITTRSLEKSIIESAGYEVLAAADGEEAWRMLQQRPVDLVVSDVEMPRMDGFALAEAIRGSRRWGRLPVVLVSALCSDTDRARGLAVGANAYIAKGTFDQHELLQTIGQLL